MRFNFVLPLPRFVLHPVTAVVIAAVHVYLAAGHLSDMIGGDVQWTHIWKGFGALGGAYVFAALATRGLAGNWRSLARSRRPATDGSWTATGQPQMAAADPWGATDGPQGATGQPGRATDGPLLATDGPQWATDGPLLATVPPLPVKNGPGMATGGLNRRPFG